MPGRPKIAPVPACSADAARTPAGDKAGEGHPGRRCINEWAADAFGDSNAKIEE